MSCVIIFANGELPGPEKARELIHSGDFLIAADGGVRHALSLGFTPDVVLGDLDSLPAGFIPSGVTKMIKFPADKNETDLELAITHALGQNPEKIVIVAALGGRFDQTLANISLLSGHHLSGVDIRIDDGVEEIFFCREQARVHGRSGDLISLIPWGGLVAGIRTKNLKWPLVNETLYPEKTRGVSNEMIDSEAETSIASGLLLVVHRRLSFNS
jgi:thiamine pyrophosphokinase